MPATAASGSCPSSICLDIRVHGSWDIRTSPARPGRSTLNASLASSIRSWIPRESTYKFLDTFIGEMAAIFPDHFMHIGGDENNGVEWKGNSRIQEFMREHSLKDTSALQNYFNQRLLRLLEKHGKHMIGWDEILTPDLPKDVMVQSWRGFDSLATGARNGYRGILSAGYYLNLMSTAAAHYAVDPLPQNSDLSSEQQARILGGEACMWEEQTNSQSIDSRIWPRTAAIAERLWSPRNVNDVDDMYRRLTVESLRLETLGLTHISHEEVGLRQLSGSEQIDPLQILASVLEPVTFDQRAHMQHANQLTPLDQFVDALSPDPPSRHNFEMLARTYLQDPAGRKEEEIKLAAIFKNMDRCGARSPAFDGHLAATRPGSTAGPATH